MTDLTPGAVALALRTCATMANKPDLAEGDYAIWCDDLTYEGVTRDELLRALGDIRRRQEFYPQVATVIERVKAHRLADGARRRAEETQERIRERRESFEALPPPETYDRDEVAPLDGLEVPPAREPRRGADVVFGPVRLPDGRLDPRWPEEKHRAHPAWLRKHMYDHGVIPYDAATAATLARAKQINRRDDGIGRAMHSLEKNR